MVTYQPILDSKKIILKPVGAIIIVTTIVALGMIEGKLLMRSRVTPPPVTATLPPIDSSLTDKSSTELLQSTAIVVASVNLALNKAVTVSSQQDSNHRPGYAVDGNNTTGWSSANVAQDRYPWFQVDLGQPYVIGQIKLVTNQKDDEPETRRNFTIWASNNPDMAMGHVVLGKQDGTSLPYKATYSLRVTDTRAYRYIAIVKSGHGHITELKVTTPYG